MSKYNLVTLAIESNEDTYQRYQVVAKASPADVLLDRLNHATGVEVVTVIYSHPITEDEYADLVKFINEEEPEGLDHFEL